MPGDIKAAVEILGKLRQANIAVRLEGDRLQVDAPKGALTAELRAELSRCKSDVIAFLRPLSADASSGNDAGIEVTPRSGLLPLSESQERLWFLDHLSPGGTAYLMPMSNRITGNLNTAIFRESLLQVVSRHESLRTVFRSTDGVPHAVILEPEPSEIPEIDLREYAPKDREAEAQRLVDCNAREPLDLARGPLWRMKILRLGERDYVVLGAFHHIIFDGWSLGVLVRELVEFYNAALENRAPAVPPLRHQFMDYIRWQKRRLDGGERQRNLTYWKAQLGEKVRPLELPSDRPPSSAGVPRGGFCSQTVPRVLFERLKALSQTEGASLYMTLLSVFQLLLHRLSGQQDILVGSPVAGRDRPETEGMIGFFVKTVVMRANFGRDRTFRELLQYVRETALGAYVHQDTPFEELIAALDPERDLNRAPLFQAFFNHQKDAMTKVETAGLKMEPFGDLSLESKFHLTLYADERDDELNLSLLYNAEMFNADRMRAFLEQYQTLLEQIAGNPDRSVETYSLLTPSALPVLPDPKMPIALRPQPAIHERFLAQATKRPKTVAISEPVGDWTYAELEQLSGGVAAWLAEQGIAEGDVVAIYGHRSSQLVIAMLGVLRAGAAFCILDPAYPAVRLCRSFESAQPKAWLQTEAAGEPPETLLSLVDRTVGARRLKLPGTHEAALRASWATKRIEPKEIAPDTLAYVTFTSGTTGEPKCIRGTLQPLSHFVDWHCSKFGLQDTDRFSMLSGLAHDPLLRDIFTPLWLGATLCIPDADQMLSPGYLAEWLQKQRVTVSHLTPAMGVLLAESAAGELSTLRYAFFGGDLLAPRVVAMLHGGSPAAQIVNFYGTTETPQAMAWHSIDPADIAKYAQNPSAAKPIPIGKPISDVQILILNAGGGLAGVGEIGEIFIRTPYLTLGYANDEKLTQARFVVNPFTAKPEDRLYRTGDLGRYRPDGIVDVAGRADQQVKIRGYRVELGEIEAALSSHQAVRKCVVIARKVQSGETRLVAYVVSPEIGRPSIAELRTHLSSVLSDYMIPASFMFIDAIPLTPNGKIDRRALPVPEGDLTAPSLGYVAPRNEVERIMAGIWSEVLGIEKVGVFEHFFELGGHSLSATRLIARLRSAFNVDLPLKSLFVEPTIAELSKHILYDSATGNYRYFSEVPSSNRLVPAQPKGSRNPLYLVAGYMDPNDTLLILSRIFPFLGLDQPVYGFQPRWLDGHSKGYSSVKEVVGEFLDELREFQPQGPYQLGGDCVGGIVALEMAEELLRQGEQVSLLVMSDTERPTPFRTFLADARIAWRRGRHMVDVIGQLILGEQTSRRQLFRDLLHRKLKTTNSQTGEKVEHDPAHRLRMDYRRMIYSHKVEKYSGRLTLIVNEKHYRADKKMGWGGVAKGGLEVISTPGDHWTRYTQHGKEFAQRLLGCLQRAQADGARRRQPSREPVHSEVAVPVNH